MADKLHISVGTETTKEKTFGCLLLLAMLPVAIIFRGFVLSRLWTWFVVPFGIMPIGLAHAYGLSILIALFSGEYAKGRTAEGEEVGSVVGRYFTHGIVMPLFMWFMGWIFFNFMTH